MTFVDEDRDSRLIIEVMTPELEVVAPSDPIGLAAQKMRTVGVGDVLVVEDDKLVGILTDRDIVVRGFTDDRDPRSIQVGEICSRDDLVWIHGDDYVADAIELMRAKAVRRLPVVEEGRPIGIVSLGDLALVRDSSETLADVSAAAPNE